MARANYGAKFLRIESRRKIPQSDEVARDDGQVAVLGLDLGAAVAAAPDGEAAARRVRGCSSSSSPTSPTKRIPLRGTVRMRR